MPEHRIGHREQMTEHSAATESRPAAGLSTLRERAGRRIDCEEAAYSESTREDRPLAGYLTLLGIYLGFAGSLAGILKWRKVELPERIDPADLALLTVATHKVSRIVTKDPVTSPLRAGFTRFTGPTGEGEIAEEVRGTGLRHAVGELVTCPFCIGQWVATLLAFMLVLAPRATRLAASVFAMLTGSDLLQLAYAKAQTWID